LKVIDVGGLTLQSIFMRIFYTVSHLQSSAAEHLNHWAFIPTMGALHDGHLSLVQHAKEHGHSVIVSIFVNPTQFNNSEDLDKYPRTIFEDLKKLASIGVDAVFLPSVNEIYPEDGVVKTVHLGLEAQSLEGHYRPGHFEGVVMVLRRLFEIVKPGHVFFGQKDLQQCMVVRRLIQQEFPLIQFNMIETMRELDGLAMSSRNARLTAEERIIANEIYQAMAKVSATDMVDSEIQILINELKTNGIKTEYFNYVSLPDLVVVSNRAEAHAVVYAGYLGKVRLIDNLVFKELP
jgi:pantoate--beta-alanine ligase